ncbi:MAG: DnaJ family domain-containing protein [Chloroflexota bacterium]
MSRAQKQNVPPSQKSGALIQGKTPEEQRAPEQDSVKKQIGPPDLDYWDDIVGQRINEAVKQGKFDNLRGAGKPLPPRGNPLAGDRQLAFDLMEDNNLAPQWINDRKIVLDLIAQLRTEIQAYAEHFQDKLSHSDIAEEQEKIREQWHWLVNHWSEKVLKLNDQIQTVNFTQPPVPTLEIFKLRIGDELKRVGVSEELLNN